MELTHIPSEKRFHVHEGWLDSRFAFSFDRYYDPANVSFGALRVLNDDRIAAASGFPTHPHREMEIVTLLLDGELEHRDSTGARQRMVAGDVQRMTAGTGIAHSEMNPNPKTPTHLLQIWVTPDTPRLAPGYEQQNFDPKARAGRFVRVVAKVPQAGELSIHQDADFHLGTLTDGQALAFTPRAAGRRQYVFAIDGRATLDGRVLGTGDQARIFGAETLPFVAGPDGAELLVIDLA